MYRTILLSLVGLVLSIPCFAQGHGSIQYLNIHTTAGTTPRMATFMTAPLYGPTGVFMYGQADRNWSEMYAGATYAPVKWLQVGTGLGTESYSQEYRFGSFLFAGYRHFALLVIDEEGAGGRFTKVDGSYSFNLVSIGGYWDNVLGGGAKVAVSIPHTPMSVWGTAQESGHQAVVQYNF